MTNGADAKVVMVTCSGQTEAMKIANTVVERRLAACVNMLSTPVESVYRWKERIETAAEYILIIKTTKDRLEELQAEVIGQHSYETPEFLVIGVETGSAGYLEWLRASV